MGAVCPRPIWPLWELGGQECSCLSVPPTASLSWSILGAGWAVALSCSGQGSHQLGYLVPQLCSALHVLCGHDRPGPYLVMAFFILTLYLVSSDHQLGICGPRVAIEISYWISNMLADPMEEKIFAMLLHLLICYPPRALQSNLTKGPFQPHGEGGTFSWLPCIPL